MNRLAEAVAAYRDASDGCAFDDLPFNEIEELADAADKASRDAPRADGKPRMSLAQRDRLWEMCGNYNVPFREDDYVLSGRQASIGAGWVEGWVGGRDGSGITSRRTVYVGVSPEGDSHT